MRSQTDRKLKRRTNILYRLRKKGIRCDTKARGIYYPYGRNPLEVVQIKRLCGEFNFNIQFIIE